MSDHGVSVVKVFADAGGASHFARETIDVQLINPGRGIPPTLASAPVAAGRAIFFAPPRGAIADWHPAPARQFNIVLSGFVEVEVSDGEKRKFKAGDVILVEDLEGQGHRTTIGSNEDALFLAITLD